MKVESVQRIGVRRLVTIDPKSKAWKGKLPDVDGCIVRVRPPSSVEPDVIEQVVTELRARGAIAVRLLPQEKGDAILPASKVASPPSKATAREVITAMVDEVAARDRDALRELVEATMELEGL